MLATEVGWQGKFLSSRCSRMAKTILQSWSQLLVMSLEERKFLQDPGKLVLNFKKESNSEKNGAQSKFNPFKFS